MQVKRFMRSIQKQEWVQDCVYENPTNIEWFYNCTFIFKLCYWFSTRWDGRTKSKISFCHYEIQTSFSVTILDGLNIYVHYVFLVNFALKDTHLQILIHLFASVFYWILMLTVEIKLNHKDLEKIEEIL